MGVDAPIYGRMTEIGRHIAIVVAVAVAVTVFVVVVFIVLTVETVATTSSCPLKFRTCNQIQVSSDEFLIVDRYQQPYQDLYFYHHQHCSCWYLHLSCSDRPWYRDEHDLLSQLGLSPDSAAVPIPRRAKEEWR